MCIDCYKDYGHPLPGAGALAAQAALEALYRHHVTGGALHIVVDDYNVDDAYLTGQRNSPDFGPWTEAEEAAFQALISLTEDQRVAALALQHGLIDEHGRILGDG